MTLSTSIATYESLQKSQKRSGCLKPALISSTLTSLGEQAPVEVAVGNADVFVLVEPRRVGVALAHLQTCETAAALRSPKGVSVR